MASVLLLPPEITMGLSAPRRSILPEVTFLQALCLERKRAERSRRPFVLMLLDPGKSSLKATGDAVLSKTVSALFSVIRETDVAGWYKDETLLGVILSELGPAAKNSIVAVLQAKITAALRSRLNAEELSRIHISFHCFPEDREDNDTGFPASAELYPDL